MKTEAQIKERIDELDSKVEALLKPVPLYILLAENRAARSALEWVLLS